MLATAGALKTVGKGCDGVCGKVGGLQGAEFGVSVWPGAAISPGTQEEDAIWDA